MLFTTAAFALFFSAVVGALVVLRRHEHQMLVLCAAGAVFYATWDARFLPLLLFTSVFDFYLALAIARAESRRRKKALLALDIVVNLGLLVWFKYLGFFAESAGAVASLFGHRIEVPRVTLPVGISFFVFEAMSYCIDVYRGQLEPARRWTRFATFLFFFPRMVAGPIVRASDFLPQLERRVRIAWPNVVAGGQQFLLGMTKKVVLADRVAPFVDMVFADPAAYSSLSVWQAVLGYAVQIYCDFSGYSDMAIGLARTLGFELPDNFRLPYLATSLTDFWRRWHISLSSWLRDYLYISLGGSRAGRARTHANLLITMTLGGLWHGASWTFVAWGLLHGLGLAVDKQLWSSRAFLALPRPARVALGWATTQGFVVAAWVFFRAQSFPAAITILKKLVSPSAAGTSWVAAPVLAVVAFVAAVHVASRGKHEAPSLSPGRLPHAVALWAWALGVFFLGAAEASPFIYFQF